MNRYICRDISDYWFKCFVLKHTYTTDDRFRDRVSSTGGKAVIWAINPSDAGKQLRSNIRHNIWRVIPSVLMLESLYYCDEGYGDDWLLNLPETFKNLYQERLDKGEDDFAFEGDFWRDIQNLSDLEIFQLVEQDVKCYDNHGGAGFRFISSWKIEA